MKRHNTYEQTIAQKLNRLTAPDVAGLWDSMEAILDKEMPQQEKKRPMGGWWRNTNLLVAASFFLAASGGYALYQQSANQLPEVAAVNANSQGKAGTSESTVAVTPFAAAKPKTTVDINNVTVAAETQKPNDAMPANAAPSLATAAKKVLPVAAEDQSKEASAGSINSNIAIEAAPLQVNETTVASAQTEAEETAAVSTAALEAMAQVSPVVPVVFQQQPSALNAAAISSMPAVAKKKEAIYVDKGISAGLAVNMPFALGKQARNSLDMKGQQNQWQDFVPAVYAQLHLSKNFYVQAEWQPVTAQYTPNFTLYNRLDVLNPDEKEQKVVKLNKLFYSSLPLSVHYKTPVKNLTVGLGAQYTKLKKVILQDQEYYHLIQAGGVFKVEERKNEVAVKDPQEVRHHNTGDVVDSVARAVRAEDWRLLADVGYQYKGFNLGVRYTRGMQPYINSNFTGLPVKDRNQSLQVYLRFNLFDSRKK